MGWRRASGASGLDAFLKLFVGFWMQRAKRPVLLGAPVVAEEGFVRKVVEWLRAEIADQEDREIDFVQSGALDLFLNSRLAQKLFEARRANEVGGKRARCFSLKYPSARFW